MGLEDWETKRKQPVPHRLPTGTGNQYTYMNEIDKYLIHQWIWSFEFSSITNNYRFSSSDVWTIQTAQNLRRMRYVRFSKVCI